MTDPTVSTDGNDPADLPWDELRAAARAAASRAYAPYSNFSVGAAALTDDGRLITGCNVENLSYGLTLCAECGLVSALHSGGGGRLRAVVVVSGSGEPCTPCGRCRQLLAEHATDDCLIDASGTPQTIEELLPGGFSLERFQEG